MTPHQSSFSLTESAAPCCAFNLTVLTVLTLNPSLLYFSPGHEAGEEDVQYVKRARRMA